MSVRPSSLREQQKGLARRLIAEATARVILRSGIHQFSMQDVADDAGVSLRTLYRYYPSRDELLEGVRAEIDEGLNDVGIPSGIEASPLIDKFGTPEAIAAVVGDAFRMTAHKGPDIARAWVIMNMAAVGKREPRRERDQIIREAVQHLGPHLTQADQNLAFGVIRYLASSIAWKVMTDDLGMDTEEVAQAVGWAVRTLLETIQAGGTITGQL